MPADTTLNSNARPSFASIAARAVPSPRKHSPAKPSRTDARSESEANAPRGQAGQCNSNKASHRRMDDLDSALVDLSIAEKCSVPQGLSDTPGPSKGRDQTLKVDDDSTQVSSRSSFQTPSVGAKSSTSLQTLGLDEKDSLRPDDSASMQAGDDDESASGPISGAPNSRMSSEAGSRAFRDQFNEVSEHNAAAVLRAQATARRVIADIQEEGPHQAGLDEFSAENQPQDPILAMHGNIGPKTVELEQQSTREPDEKIFEALESLKDRMFLLRLEQDIIDFIKNSSDPAITLPPCNSFGRLLAHKLADYYELTHYVDNAVSAVTLYRTPYCRIPTPLSVLADARNRAGKPVSVPVPQPTMKIMRRPGVGGESSRLNSGVVTRQSSTAVSKATSEAGEAGEDSLAVSQSSLRSESRAASPTESTVAKERGAMTRAEREARYREKREQLFGPQSESAETNGSNEVSRSSSRTDERKRNKRRMNPVNNYHQQHAQLEQAYPEKSDDDFEARSQYNAYFPTEGYETMPMHPSYYGMYGMPTDPRMMQQQQQQHQGQQQQQHQDFYPQFPSSNPYHHAPNSSNQYSFPSAPASMTMPMANPAEYPTTNMGSPTMYAIPMAYSNQGMMTASMHPSFQYPISGTNSDGNFYPMTPTAAPGPIPATGAYGPSHSMPPQSSVYMPSPISPQPQPQPMGRNDFQVSNFGDIPQMLGPRSNVSYEGWNMNQSGNSHHSTNYGNGTGNSNAKGRFSNINQYQSPTSRTQRNVSLASEQAKPGPTSQYHAYGQIPGPGPGFDDQHTNQGIAPTAATASTSCQFGQMPFTSMPQSGSGAPGPLNFPRTSFNYNSSVNSSINREELSDNGTVDGHRQYSTNPPPRQHNQRQTQRPRQEPKIDSWSSFPSTFRSAPDMNRDRDTNRGGKKHPNGAFVKTTARSPLRKKDIGSSRQSMPRSSLENSDPNPTMDHQGHQGHQVDGDGDGNANESENADEAYEALHIQKTKNGKDANAYGASHHPVNFSTSEHVSPIGRKRNNHNNNTTNTTNKTNTTNYKNNNSNNHNNKTANSASSPTTTSSLAKWATPANLPPKPPRPDSQTIGNSRHASYASHAQGVSMTGSSSLSTFQNPDGTYRQQHPLPSLHSLPSRPFSPPSTSSLPVNSSLPAPSTGLQLPERPIDIRSSNGSGNGSGTKTSSNSTMAGGVPSSSPSTRASTKNTSSS